MERTVKANESSIAGETASEIEPILVVGKDGRDSDARISLYAVASANTSIVFDSNGGRVLQRVKARAPGSGRTSTPAVTIYFRTIDAAYAISAWLKRELDEAANCVCGLQELLINAVEHGNLEIGLVSKANLLRAGRYPEYVAERLCRPEFQDRVADLRLQWRPGMIVCTITDEGPGFDREALRQLKAEKFRGPNGHGLLVAENCGFSAIEYAGNRVEVVIPQP